MSNYVSRTLTVTRDQYNRLQSLASEATSLRNRLLSLQNDNRTLQSDLDTANSHIRRSEQQFEEIWTELHNNTAHSEELQAAISQAHARITEHAQQMQNNLSQMQSEFVSYVEDSIHDNNRLIDQVITQNTRALTGMIDTLRADTDQALSDLQHEVATLAHGDQELLEDARNYYSQLDGILNAIEQTRYATLLPGQYEAEVKPLLENANDELATASRNPANAPVARTATRSAFVTALHFLEEITNAEQEWQAQLAVTEQLADLLEQQIEGSRTIALTPNVQMDVNEWSRGDLAEAEQTFRSTRSVLQNPEVLEGLTTQQLIDLQSTFQTISGSLNDIVTNAYVECNTSQHIVQIAQRVNVTLWNEANMQVIAHAFEGGDRHGNYRFIVRNNGTGLTIAITVSRVRNGDSVNISTEADIVNYGSMAADTAENLVRRTINTVTNTVAGFEAGQTECHGHAEIVHEHEHRGDITNWEHPSVDIAASNA